MPRAFLQALLVGALLMASASLSWAQSNGQQEFERHCALCHGLNGKGGGPLADAMKLVPADLTRLAAHSNGAFPASRVGDVIRNGGGVLGHGSSAMLPWGNYFGEKGKPEAAKTRIADLVAYIRSLQQQ
jgi:mono/diheme cytochrome c family protein